MINRTLRWSGSSEAGRKPSTAADVTLNYLA